MIYTVILLILFNIAIISFFVFDKKQSIRDHVFNRKISRLKLYDKLYDYNVRRNRLIKYCYALKKEHTMAVEQARRTFIADDDFCNIWLNDPSVVARRIESMVNAIRRDIGYDIRVEAMKERRNGKTGLYTYTKIKFYPLIIE